MTSPVASSGSTGTPAFAISRFDSILEPIVSIAVRRRPDPDQPGVAHRAGEPGVLGEEPVAGVHRVRAGLGGRGDHQVGAQVGLGRRVAGQPHGRVRVGDVRGVGVRVGVHRDRADAARAGRVEHPAGDLAPVGHQQFRDHVGPRVSVAAVMCAVAPDSVCCASRLAGRGRARLAEWAGRATCRKTPKPLGASDRGAVHDGQAKAEHCAGVARVDDAVVVEPCRTGTSAWTPPRSAPRRPRASPRPASSSYGHAPRRRPPRGPRWTAPRPAAPGPSPPTCALGQANRNRGS